MCCLSMPRAWAAIPERQKKRPVQIAEAERKWSIWELARTFMAGLSWGSGENCG